MMLSMRLELMTSRYLQVYDLFILWDWRSSQLSHESICECIVNSVYQYINFKLQSATPIRKYIRVITDRYFKIYDRIYTEVHSSCPRKWYKVVVYVIDRHGRIPVRLKKTSTRHLILEWFSIQLFFSVSPLNPRILKPIQAFSYSVDTSRARNPVQRVAF